MEKTNRQRITYIAQAQLVGCILVILGHSIPLNWQVPNVIKVVDEYLYNFHMPLFFFVSGYLFYKTDSVERYSYLHYIKKRSWRLLIPYVAVTLIGIVPKVFTSGFFNDGGEFSVWYLFKNFFAPRENVWGHLWFLPTLFLISLFSFLFAKLKNRTKAGYTVLVILLFGLPLLLPLTEWLAINDVFKNTCFYALGILFAKSVFEKTFEKHRAVFLLSLPVAIITYVFAGNNNIINILLKEASAVCMLFFVLTICTYFDITNLKTGKFLIKKTYPIYLLSWPFQCIVSLVFEKLLQFPYYITMPIAFLAGVFGPIVTILIIGFIEKKIGKRIISPIIGG